MGSQAPDLLIPDDSKTSTNDTKEANTFLINVNNDNSKHSHDDIAGESQHTTHLASINDRIANALALNSETNHTKIQTSKFI